MTDIDDVLIKKIVAGDMDSFETLVARYQQKVFAFIYRMGIDHEDSLDITQEVFIQIFKSLSGFKSESKFSTWLYRIASNKTLDWLRKNKGGTKPQFVELEENHLIEESVSDNPESIFIRKERTNRLKRLIDDLPDKYKVALILFNYQDLSYQQISEALGIPIKTVATRIYRAKLILKEKIERSEANGLP